MTEIIVRVRRTYTERVTEYVDVPINTSAKTLYQSEKLAKALVIATMDAGQLLNWSAELRENINSYSDSIEATALPLAQDEEDARAILAAAAPQRRLKDPIHG